MTLKAGAESRERPNDQSINEISLAGDEIDCCHRSPSELVAALVLAPASAGPVAGTANLYAVGELVAGRAARPATRSQYAGIYRRFADLLRAELGRPPTVADLSADAIAGYARRLEAAGGRGGGPAGLATRRVHITMLRALASELGLEEVAKAVRLPSHTPGPPETLTAAEYANLLRVPDRRAVAGRRAVLAAPGQRPLLLALGFFLAVVARAPRLVVAPRFDEEAADDVVLFEGEEVDLGALLLVRFAPEAVVFEPPWCLRGRFRLGVFCSASHVRKSSRSLWIALTTKNSTEISSR